MASTDDPDPSPAEEQTGRARGRIRQVVAGTRGLIRVAYRDPEHVAERLTLFAVDRLADPSRDWATAALAARPGVPAAELAEELRIKSAGVARIDGAISGTPFFIALAPGYMSYLWQEMRMTLRTAALYGRDTRDLRTAAEMLALRGVHPDVDTAHAALTVVQETPMPARPPQRRPFRHWVHSVFLLLVFGGFLSADSAERPNGVVEVVRAVAGTLVGIAIWVMTWVFPVTFMVMMAWGCETHARQLGRRALVFYDGEAASVHAAIATAARRRDRGHDKRALIRSVLLFLSVAIPIAFIALVDHLKKTTGINWIGALGALVAVSLVIATAVLASRS
jgi:hypothetical protein